MRGKFWDVQVFAPDEDIHFTEENNQNYGGCTPQNFMQKAI